MRWWWNRIGRPWTRGAIILVTAAVTLVGALTIARADGDAPPTVRERDWAEEESVVHDPIDDHGLTETLDQLFPTLYEDFPSIDLFAPPGDRYMGFLGVIPAGEYDVYAACVFAEEAVHDAGGRSSVSLWSGRQDLDDAVTVDVECHREPYAIGHDVDEAQDFAVSATVHVLGISVDEVMGAFSTRIDGELMDASSAVRLVFVPKAG